jgi:hypothetical protein
MGVKPFILNNLKNIAGKTIDRQIVVFSVDDYGNIRLGSPESCRVLDTKGIKARNKFDEVDCLDSREDLEQLYYVLHSVQDINGRPAVFSPYVVTRNIDFDKTEKYNYQELYFEELPQTISKQGHSSFRGAWELWQEGIRGGYFVPQFHGREHLNLRIVNEKLAKKDQELIEILKTRSFTRVSGSGYPTIAYTAAFDFWELSENAQFESIITDGLESFNKLFGYKAIQFNAPGGRESSQIHKYLLRGGIRFLDAPLIKREHLGQGKYERYFHYTGKKNNLGQIYFVRNCVFEPVLARNYDPVDYVMRQIEAAFRWKKPAIISSHRVNFCGYIDPENRKKGLKSLADLLAQIKKKWPSVEFMSASELSLLMFENGQYVS